MLTIILIFLFLSIFLFIFIYFAYRVWINNEDERKKVRDQVEEIRRNEQRKREIEIATVQLRKEIGILDTKLNKLDYRAKENKDKIDGIEKTQNEILPEIESIDKSIKAVEDKLSTLTLSDIFEQTDEDKLLKGLKEKLELIKMSQIDIGGYEIKRNNKVNPYDSSDLSYPDDFLNPELRFYPHANALSIKNSDLPRDGIDVNNVFIRGGQLSFDTHNDDGDFEAIPNISLMENKDDLDIYLTTKNNSLNIKERVDSPASHMLYANGNVKHTGTLMVPKIDMGDFSLEVKDEKLVVSKKGSLDENVIS